MEEEWRRRRRRRRSGPIKRNDFFYSKFFGIFV